uniref:Uncharacterized protein n=1 Tax=Marseillevirus LCMAC201 TaxID=2506605 RepID=A0A481YVP3_9VIRU|nr:MAG: hypothetical protein LCMAC201_01440 [Marseillevirus LCMAC201]
MVIEVIEIYPYGKKQSLKEKKIQLDNIMAI